MLTVVLVLYINIMSQYVNNNGYVKYNLSVWFMYDTFFCYFLNKTMCWGTYH